MIHQIVYVSRATSLMSTLELSTLLEQARKRNSELSLTGMLLYKDKSFIQLIEGPVDSLQAVVASIKKDQRHVRFAIVIDQEVESRTFKQWSMSFVNLNTESHHLDGFVDYFADGSIIDDLVAKPSKALELLTYFRMKS